MPYKLIDIYQPDMLAPALLIAAIERIAGGSLSLLPPETRLVGIREDMSSLTGYRFTALRPSAPWVLRAAIADILSEDIRTDHGRQEVWLDPAIVSFWCRLKGRGLAHSHMDDLDIRFSLGLSDGVALPTPLAP